MIKFSTWIFLFAWYYCCNDAVGKYLASLNCKLCINVQSILLHVSSRSMWGHWYVTKNSEFDGYKTQLLGIFTIQNVMIIFGDLFLPEYVFFNKYIMPIKAMSESVLIHIPVQSGCSFSSKRFNTSHSPPEVLACQYRMMVPFNWDHCPIHSHCLHTNITSPAHNQTHPFSWLYLANDIDASSRLSLHLKPLQYQSGLCDNYSSQINPLVRKISKWQGVIFFDLLIPKEHRELFCVVHWLYW